MNIHSDTTHYATTRLRSNDMSAAGIQHTRDEIARLVTLTREEPGCLSFIITEVAETPGEFVLWEIFRNDAALDVHMNAAHTQHYFTQNLTELLTHTRTKAFDSTPASDTAER